MFTFIALGLVMVLLLGVFVRYREKKRTTTLLEEKNRVIEAKNQDIMDSMRYAQRIQGAILPPVALAQQTLGDAFVLFRPKELVSGDFYWIREQADQVLFAAVDCTGHGVPGAMVSMVGHNQLNRTVVEFGLSHPGEILGKLNELVQEVFHNEESALSDGMDLALCAYQPSSRTIEFAGANNPMYIVRHHGDSTPEPIVADIASIVAVNGSWHLQEVKGTKRPIGPHQSEPGYANHRLQLQSGDSVYLFSDGFADQFGGVSAASRQRGGKKFKYGAFRKLLLSIQDQPMDKQQSILNETIESWMGELEQLDDISVIGMKVQ